MRRLLALLLVSLFFVGCSSKQYFQPQKVAGEVSFDGTLPAPIVDVLRDGATLQNGMFISKDGVESYTLPKGFLFINKAEGKYIAAHKCGAVEVIDAKDKKILYKRKFKMRSAVAANIHGDILAMVFDNDSLMAVNLKSKEVLYDSLQTPDIAVDTKIANPYFLGRLIIFPTLDGKLVVFDSETKKELRTLVVGSKKLFNNVIFLSVINDNLIAATPSRIIAVSPTSLNALELPISDVLYVAGRVYILTKDGEVILADANLNVLKKRKYPFAHFTGAIYGEYLYIIEKEGYIIALDKDMRVSNIFKFPTEIENYIFTAKDKVFYDDKYFKLNR